MDAHALLGLESGTVIANPIPEGDEIARAEIDDIVEQALTALTTSGVHGRDVTPWLLGRIVDATHGRSLSANIALVKHNAALAARIERVRAGH